MAATRLVSDELATRLEAALQERLEEMVRLVVAERLPDIQERLREDAQAQLRQSIQDVLATERSTHQT